MDIFVEHLYDDQWDYDVEISRSLGDDALLHDEINEITQEDASNSDSDENIRGLNQNEVEEDNLIDTTTSSKHVSAGCGVEIGGQSNMQE